MQCLNIFGRTLSDGELWGTRHRGSLQHIIVSCSFLCTLMKYGTDHVRECQARLIRPLACVGVMWTAVWYYTTLLVRTATDRPYLRFIYLT
jgi:hypothetical protein